MCSKNQLYDITRLIAEQASRTFDDKLDSVILYGSYARCEETSESDIDIMILVDLQPESLSQYKKTFIGLSSELGLKYDVVVSVTLKDICTFNRYLDAVPFYSNVKKDGVRIAV